MLRIEFTSQFKKDYKLAMKRGLPKNELEKVISLLSAEKKLPEKYRDHELISSKNYKNVTIFASNGIARNNFGGWRVESVNVDHNITGFEFYTQKDLEMAKKADIGFMIWNGKSRGTFNNIVNCIKLNKEVIIYYLTKRKFYYIKTMDDLYKFLDVNVKLNYKLKKLLPKKETTEYIQACLF